MPRVSHLIRRNGVYWFKIDLPHELAGQRLPPSVPDILKQLESPSRSDHLKTAIWLSLRTTVEREAKQRVGIQIARHARLFDAARAFLVKGDPLSETDLLQEHSQTGAIRGAWTRPETLHLALPSRHGSSIGAAEVGGAAEIVTSDAWTITSLLTHCTRKSVGEIDSILPIWGSVNLLRTFAVKEDMRKQADRLGCDWDQKQRVFRLADGEGPPLALTAQELVELGVELVMLGTQAMVERRWQ